MFSYMEFCPPMSISMPFEIVLLPPSNRKTKREESPTLSYISDPIVIMEESSRDKDRRPQIIEMIDKDKEERQLAYATLSPPSSSPSPPSNEPNPTGMPTLSIAEFLQDIIGFMSSIQTSALSTTLLPIPEELSSYQ